MEAFGFMPASIMVNPKNTLLLRFGPSASDLGFGSSCTVWSDSGFRAAFEGHSAFKAEFWLALLDDGFCQHDFSPWGRGGASVKRECCDISFRLCYVQANRRWELMLVCGVNHVILLFQTEAETAGLRVYSEVNRLKGFRRL